MHEYDTRDMQRLSGAGASAVRSLARAGHINPVRRAGRLRYSFRDLVIVRTANALRGANVPPRKVNSTLSSLRASLPAGAPLSAVSVTVLGNQVAVREGDALFEPDTGQYALRLEVVRAAGELLVLETRGSAPALADLSSDFEGALALEEGDSTGAVSAYLACLEADPGHVEARTNLGRLLHELQRHSEAERVYREATSSDAVLQFNLAVLVEDCGRDGEAILLYQGAIALDPFLADAHFNLARLHDIAGRARESFRHLLAYRRLTKGAGG